MCRSLHSLCNIHLPEALPSCIYAARKHVQAKFSWHCLHTCHAGAMSFIPDVRVNSRSVPTEPSTFQVSDERKACPGRPPPPKKDCTTCFAAAWGAAARANRWWWCGWTRRRKQQAAGSEQVQAGESAWQGRTLHETSRCLRCGATCKCLFNCVLSCPRWHLWEAGTGTHVFVYDWSCFTHLISSKKGGLLLHKHVIIWEQRARLCPTDFGLQLASMGQLLPVLQRIVAPLHCWAPSHFYQHKASFPDHHP